MDISATQVATVMMVLQQVGTIILAYMTIGYLPEVSIEGVHGLVRTLFSVLDLAQPVASIMAQGIVVEEISYLAQDMRVVMWFIACNVAAFVGAWGVLRLWTDPPSLAGRIFGCLVLVLSPLALVMLHETWHRLVSGYVLSLVIQVGGWWNWIGTNIPSGRISDIREVWASVKQGKPFDPTRYMCLKKGVFVGLDEKERAVYVPLKEFRRHWEIIGQTRAGKGLGACTLLDQAAQLGECVVILDPKGDTFMPSVMAASAQRAGVPFTLIDLREGQPPQLNLLAGCTPQDIEEMLIQVFDLTEKGDNADIYRIQDRAAARLIAGSGACSFPELYDKAAQMLDQSKTRRLYEALRELAFLPAIQTAAGIDLSEIVGRPGILYVTGSTRYEPVVRLQKAILLRVLQILDKRGQEKEGIWTALFLDEFKYLLSPAALQALGVIADRRCHLLLAHQSLGDLRDTTLPAAAVEGAVLVNCALKLLFRTNDPDTATWEARVCGTVPVHTEVTQKTIFKFHNAEGSWRESARPIFDENILQSLPPFCAILVGAGVPQKVRFGFLPVGERPTPVPAPIQSPTNQELI